MANINDLRSALELLQTIDGQYVETDVEVDPNAELSGVYRYVGAGGTVSRPTREGPAMVFNNVKGHPDARVAIGVLAALGEGLNTTFDGNHYLVTGLIGVLSSIVDNVPLVAGCMGMYPMAEVGDMAQDGIFWQLLAYCAGVGGSMLIIGSAAGVVVMGLEKITFGWYMKRITWIAFIGYIAGILAYWVEKSVIGL